MAKKTGGLSGYDIESVVGKAIKEPAAQPVKVDVGIKRLSLKMPSELHLRLKLASPKIGKTMAEICFEAVEKELEIIEKQVGR
ncbi:MAG: hypothetical protein JZU50_08320 [Desulfobulbaceae bacterium]|jgi:hypothetical protein|nr:hypothetical protein [Desulfobulbaceae bacterium]